MTDLVFRTDGRGPSLTTHTGADLIASFDAVILRSFMPFVSETLTVARMFRAAGKVVLDRCLTEEGYAMSKMHDYLVLAEAGLAVPRTVQCFDVVESTKAAAVFGFPCVVKGTFGACGTQVYRVDQPEDLKDVLSRETPGHFMVQEFLPADRDYRVMVVGGRALPVFVERRPPPGDFRTNFDLHSTITPVPLAARPDLQTLAERAARTLRRQFAGVDIRERDGVPLILEVNRRPGFQGFEAATGFDVAGALMDEVARLCAARDGAVVDLLS